jgi:hypothetical protein
VRASSLLRQLAKGGCAARRLSWVTPGFSQSRRCKTTASAKLACLQVDSRGSPIGTHADYGQGNLYVTNRINTPEIAFRNSDGGDDSDPYRLRKVRSASNTNWLELQLNDDSNEEFRIYGNSCAGYGCGEYSGNLYHFFRADGTAYHAGNLGLGTTGPGYRLDVNGDMRATGSVYLTDGNTRLVRGDGNALRVQTNSGYLDMGPMGTELEFVIMVIAVSCVKLLSAHNSTQHTSRKHKV